MQRARAARDLPAVSPDFPRMHECAARAAQSMLVWFI